MVIRRDLLLQLASTFALIFSNLSQRGTLKLKLFDNVLSSWNVNLILC